MRSLLILPVAALLLLAGCGEEGVLSPKWFTTTEGLVELEYPSGWHENSKQHPYDLQCFSRFKKMTSGVFVYQTIDMASDSTPASLLDFHVEDIRSKRRNVTIVEPRTTTNSAGKTINSVVIAGDKDRDRYYYLFSLVEFDDNPELILVLLQVSFPSAWDENRPVLMGIVESARVKQTD